MVSSNSEKITNLLWSIPQAGGIYLYAILDGARNEGIYPAIVQSGCEYECLYRGELDPGLAEAAPYLVKLEKDKPFSNWLIDEGWGDSWGVFIHTAATFRDLKRHLRKFLMVYDADTKPMYFRYYDPRVLRAYLPTCNSEELAIVFGPVKSYLLEDKNSNMLLHFSINVNKLETHQHSLT